ncbi:putative Gag-Pol polyprotein-like 7 [Homarus americanus]|uniref:Putative Gag-Pol polyprotein-like 7 n=1 Tax=Homarus americanus TaxID=6706 RepID=A0A8J5N8R0_HOMAM|nr:putative Gag-Pol polyprotein-like 7 [Homarus americanus]
MRDQFVDTLDSMQLKIQVKQSQPVTLQEVLARALEFESYVRSSLLCFREESNTGFKALKGQLQEAEKFKGTCWYCENIGHKRRTRAREGQYREERGKEKMMYLWIRWTLQH